MEYKYHHMGIPVTEPRPGERYSPTMDMYTSGGELPGRVYSIIGLDLSAHLISLFKPCLI